MIEYMMADVRAHLVPRLETSHKGTYGTALIAAGSPGMMGAAIFAAKAAYRCGTGLVKILIPQSQSMVMTLAVPEAVQLLYEDDEKLAARQLPEGINSAVLGPGLGKNHVLFEKIMTTLPEEIPLVVDADGLNLLARSSLRRKGLILTPHVGEAARLLHCTTGEILKDRIAAAKAIACEYQSVTVLKGVPTLVAEPDAAISTDETMSPDAAAPIDGRLGCCRVGNPGMSTAGSGDVLAGILGGLLAQKNIEVSLEKNDLFETAMTGVWLHGLAGDAAAKVCGQYALMASDMLEALRPDQLTAEP